MKKIIISFVLGILLSGTIAYAYVFYAKDISYDNTTSSINVNNVQDAIDNLYQTASQMKKGSAENSQNIFTEVNLGFRPSFLYLSKSNGVVYVDTVFINNTIISFRTNDLYNFNSNVQLEITDTGFRYKQNFTVTTNLLYYYAFA